MLNKSKSSIAPVARLGLAMLVLMLGTTFGASSVSAANTSYPLTPPVLNAPEPDALGKVTYSQSFDRKSGYFKGEATVACKSLTPRKAYDVVFLVVTRTSTSWGGVYESYSYLTQTVVADKKGSLSTQVSYGQTYLSSTYVELMFVGNEAGAVVLELSQL